MPDRLSVEELAAKVQEESAWLADAAESPPMDSVAVDHHRAVLIEALSDLAALALEADQLRQELQHSESLAVRESESRLRLTQRAVVAEARADRAETALRALMLAEPYEHQAVPDECVYGHDAPECVWCEGRAALAGTAEAETEEGKQAQENAAAKGSPRVAASDREGLCDQPDGDSASAPSSVSAFNPPYRYEPSVHGPITIYDAVDVGWIARVKESLPRKEALAAAMVAGLNAASASTETETT